MIIIADGYRIYIYSTFTAVDSVTVMGAGGEVFSASITDVVAFAVLSVDCSFGLFFWIVVVITDHDFIFVGWNWISRLDSIVVFTDYC